MKPHAAVTQFTVYYTRIQLYPDQYILTDVSFDGHTEQYSAQCLQ